MICPSCSAEYRDGFYRCSDCNVDLVSELRTVDEKPDLTSTGSLVLALETKDSVFLSELVSLIEHESIPYLLKCGTAFDYIENSAVQDVTWRAVLFVPEGFVDKIQSLASTVKVGVIDHGHKPYG